MQDAAAATGNGTVLDMNARLSAVVQVFGTFVGTITWEGTVDGATWAALAVADLGSTTRARELTTTVVKLVLIEALGGLSMVRARISAYTSGNISAWAQALA